MSLPGRGAAAWASVTFLINDVHHQGALQPFPKVPGEPQEPGGMSEAALTCPSLRHQGECPKAPAPRASRCWDGFTFPREPDPWRLKRRQGAILGGRRPCGKMLFPVQCPLPGSLRAPSPGIALRHHPCIFFTAARALSVLSLKHEPQAALSCYRIQPRSNVIAALRCFNLLVYNLL